MYPVQEEWPARPLLFFLARHVVEWIEPGLTRVTGLSAAAKRQVRHAVTPALHCAQTTSRRQPLSDFRQRQVKGHRHAQESFEAMMTVEPHGPFVLGIDNHGEGYNL